jgi:hypothetical protein
MKSYEFKLVLFALTSPCSEMMQVCKLTKSAALLHQRCKLVNKQKWTITAQNINIKVIGSSSNGTKWLNYRCVNYINCRTNYWKVLNRNINHAWWQCTYWYRSMHLPANTSGVFYEFGLSIITILFLLCTQFAWIK